MIFDYIQKNVDSLLRLRFLMVLGKPFAASTSKSPRIQREHQLLLLRLSSKFPNLSESKNKANASSICPYVVTTSYAL